eukprot:4174202-Pyramimonas_sp.AAC.1
MHWPTEWISHAVTFVPAAKLGKSLGNFTMSTAFSGIGAPETAACFLASAFRESFPADYVGRPRLLSCVEWSTASRDELAVHPLSTEHDSCHFGDISSFFVPELSETIAKLKAQPHLALQLLGPAIQSGNAMGTRAWCHTHKQHCCIKGARLHVAGTPCPDYSAIGTQCGPSIVDELAWIGQRRQLQESVVPQENAKELFFQMYEDLLRDNYDIEHCILDSFDFGFPYHRVRRYIVYRNRRTTATPNVTLADVLDGLKRPCGTDIIAFKVADESEIQSELGWALSRKSVQLLRAQLGESAPARELTPASIGDFKRALTATEQEYLANYQRRWPGCACSLNQNPPSGFTIKSWDDGGLQCITSRNHITWCRGRWLVPRELLLSQVFPVSCCECVQKRAPACSFHVERAEKRHNSRASRQFNE